MSNELKIKNLHVSVDGEKILKGVDLEIEKGLVNAIMGPNGSGKSTLAYALMGHPKYEITEGEVIFKGKNVLDMEPDERAKLGLFLAFQYPHEVSGVSVSNFLRTALNAKTGKKISVLDFRDLLKEKMELLEMDDSFANRYLNEGFSGGEKKKTEILQMITLNPEIAILDETDSGLDVDALKIVSKGINSIKDKSGVLLITHYKRILDYVNPDKVHILIDGKVAKSGGPELAEKVEEEGYEWIK